jgi:anaerobic ribonucleoside-triphosphate reductase
MDLSGVVDRYCGHDEAIMNENANKNSKVFATQRDLLAGSISKEYALEKLLPKNVAEGHRKGWIHFHDLDYTLNASGGLYNCMLIDFPGMLKHGFTLGEAEISTPKSLKTAGEVIPQIIANVSSNMYGGVSAHRLDEFLEPYAVISYRKTLKKNFARMAEFDGVVLTEDEIDSLADYYASQIEQTDNEFKIEFNDVKKIDSKLSEKTIQFVVEISKKDVIKEVFDTFQSLETEISSLFSGNGQTPFVTFNFGLSTGFWGREIQKGILQNRLIGLGEDHRTPVFPKLVFTLKDGVNLKKTDPNYDIKRLAVECSAKRIYPDILSYEKVMEIYGFFVSPMGCVAGDETVEYSVDGTDYSTSISEMWDMLSFQGVKKQVNGRDEFIDLSGVLVNDSHRSSLKQSNVFRMVKNYNNHWLKITATDSEQNELTLTCTTNHPLAVYEQGRVLADNLSTGDKLIKSLDSSQSLTVPQQDRLLEVVSIEPVDIDEPSYDLTTDSDYFDVSGIVSHNCRSFLTEYRSPETGEVVTYGRRNIGVVSLNLPNIALSTSTPEEFMELFDERAVLVHDGLMYRYNRLAGTLAKNAPILYQYGATGHRLSGDEVVQPIFDNGEATASIGYIGLHEVATRFWGNDWQDNEEAKTFTVGVLERLNYWKSKWADETGIAFSVYGTPAESLCSRFAAMDKETFGEVKDITDKGYYTNSFHLDVRKKVTPFEKIDFESTYTPLSTGGNICYVEQPSLVKNLDAFEAIWDYMHDHVPFSGINTPISRCLSCGYHGDFDADVKGFFCPECSNCNPETIEVIQRMCGYISSVGIRKPISGRVKEIKSRVKHG